MKTILTFPISVMLLLTPDPVSAGTRSQIIEGPVSARLVKVIDGDTIIVSAEPWPQQTMEVSVRLRGIDAPEIHSRCKAEREAASVASAALERLAGSSAVLQLAAIAGDKYFGRILADVYLEDGRNPAKELLQKGLVTVYNGGKKPVYPCTSGK